MGDPIIDKELVDAILTSFHDAVDSRVKYERAMDAHWKGEALMWRRCIDSILKNGGCMGKLQEQSVKSVYEQMEKEDITDE